MCRKCVQGPCFCFWLFCRASGQPRLQLPGSAKHRPGDASQKASQNQVYKCGNKESHRPGSAGQKASKNRFTNVAIGTRHRPRHIFFYREVWVMGQPSGQDRKAKWACLKSPLYMAKWAAACGAKGVMPRRPAHRRQRKGDLWAIWHKLRKAASSSLSWQRLLF